MSALHRQRALEHRRQCYRVRRADETTTEKERRQQGEREQRRQRLLGESAEPKKPVVRGFEDDENKRGPVPCFRDSSTNTRERQSPETSKQSLGS